MGALIVVLLPGSALAQSATTASATVDEIASNLVSRGYHSDSDVSGQLLSAIDEANETAVAFAWVATESDAVDLSATLADEMTIRQARFDTVLVLTDVEFAAWSNGPRSQPQLDAGLDQAAPLFSNGDVAGGVSAFVRGVQQADSAAGASGIVWFIAIAGALIAIIWVVMSLVSGLQRRKREANEMEQDRAEIKQQLLDNADRVMNLGDQAIESGRQDLITTYEQASAAYQEVSLNVDLATDPAQVDALDDKIDHAEWQFEVIEASLDGREPPPSPAEVAASEAEARAMSKHSPALGPNESVLTPDQIPPDRGGGLFSIGRPLPRHRVPYGGYGSRRSQRRYGGSMGSSRPRGVGGGRSLGSRGGRGGGRRL